MLSLFLKWYFRASERLGSISQSLCKNWSTHCQSWGMFEGGSTRSRRIILCQTISMIFIAGLCCDHSLCWMWPTDSMASCVGRCIVLLQHKMWFLCRKMACADRARCSCRILVYWNRSRLPLTSTSCPLRPCPMQHQNMRISLFRIRIGWLQLGTYRSFSWRRTIILLSHLNSVTWNSSQKMTRRQFPWTSSVVCDQLPSIDSPWTGSWLKFQFAMHTFRWFRWSLQDKITQKKCYKMCQL